MLCHHYSSLVVGLLKLGNDNTKDIASKYLWHGMVFSMSKFNTHVNGQFVLSVTLNVSPLF